MKFQESSRFLPVIFSYLPLIVLFSLAAFLYLTYMLTYLIPMFLVGNEQFISIKSLQFSESISQELTVAGNPSFERKKYILAGVLHALLLFFLISVLRTIFTNPGNVPDEWNTQTEKEFNEVIEAEKKVLRNIREQLLVRKREEEESDLQSKFQGSINVSSMSDVSFGSHRDTIESKRDERESQNEVVEEKKQYNEPILPLGTIKGDPTGKLLAGEFPKNSPRSQSKLETQHTEPEKEDLVAQKVHQLAVVSALKRANKRFCPHCLKFKPERTHHCRQCGVCVLKMDHHCPWVANCIGFRNHKFFMNLLVYGLLLLIFLLVTYSPLVKASFFNPEVPSPKLYLILVSYIIACLLSIAVFIFFCFHLWIALHGKTTLEYCEGKYTRRYDLGKFENLKRVFGKHVLLWLFPIDPNTTGDGLNFN